MLHSQCANSIRKIPITSLQAKQQNSSKNKALELRQKNVFRKTQPNEKFYEYPSKGKSTLSPCSFSSVTFAVRFQDSFAPLQLAKLWWASANWVSKSRCWPRGHSRSCVALAVFDQLELFWEDLYEGRCTTWWPKALFQW